MANRIEGNTYIVDTGSANTPLPWNTGSRIQSISFWSSNSSGEVIFSGVDTTNVIARLANPSNGNSSQTAYQYIGGVTFDNMKVPTLTVGTAWIYFS